MHLINKHFGGVVAPGVKNEYGETDIKVSLGCKLFNGLERIQRVLMSHGDSVKKLADGFEIGALSGDVCASLYDKVRKIYGVQFHPEVDLTINGMAILENFLKKICGLSGNYILEDRIATAIEKIKESVGCGEVLALVSGGVDSAVTVALLLKALGKENIYAIHVDHGLMRKNESDIICRQLEKFGLKNLIREHAEDRFLNSVVKINGESIGPLTALIDPEKKRNLIGHVFVELVNDVTSRLGLDPKTTFLAQGTLRPDLIESGNPDVSTTAHKIKTHHNDVEIIRKAREKGMVVETNWDWHKDEVRQVARKLGIDEKIASRQPFPGPGLAIRIICHNGQDEVAPEIINDFEKLISSLKPDYSGVILPIKSVGVQGDLRSYKHLSLLWGKGIDLDWEKVYKYGTDIPNKIPGINRVAYILNRERIDSEIQCYEMYLTKENLDLLRELDFIISQKLADCHISQIPAVLVPIGIKRKLSIAIRTFITNDYMTGRPAIIGKDIEIDLLASLVDEIVSGFSEIEFILYDVTSKPPATVEWQ
jgi:GMP synthase (glutamine-hydrolysing)